MKYFYTVIITYPPPDNVPTYMIAPKSGVLTIIMKALLFYPNKRISIDFWRLYRCFFPLRRE